MSHRILALSKSDIIQTSLAISLEHKRIVIDRLHSWDQLADQIMRQTYTGLVIDSKISATKNLSDFFIQKNLPRLPLLILLNRNEGVSEFSVEGSETEFLEKPFLTDELGQTMMRLLKFTDSTEDDSSDLTDPSPPLASFIDPRMTYANERLEKSSMSFIDAETDDETDDGIDDDSAKTVIAESTDRPKHNLELDHFDLESEEDGESENELALPDDDGQGELPTNEFYLTEEIQEISSGENLGQEGDRILNDIGNNAFLGNEAVVEESEFVESSDLNKTIFDPTVLAEADLDGEDWNRDFGENESVILPLAKTQGNEQSQGASENFLGNEKEENSLNDLLVSSEELDRMEESDKALESAIFDLPALGDKDEQRNVITAPIELAPADQFATETKPASSPLARENADFTGFQIVDHSETGRLANKEGTSPGRAEYQYFNFEEALAPLAEPAFAPVTSAATPINAISPEYPDLISNAGGSDFVDRFSDTEVNSYIHRLVHGNFTKAMNQTLPVTSPSAAVAESHPIHPTMPAIDDKKIEGVLTRSIERIVAEYIAQKAPQIIEDIVQKRINRILSDLLGEKE